MISRLVAFGMDKYWIGSVKRVMKGWEVGVAAIKCTGNLKVCLSRLPDPDENSVVIVDASGQSQMKEIVASLRSRGWQYVIVVAADPNAKEAISILRPNLAYDYWEKTYDNTEIGNRIRQCFDEIAHGRLNRKRVSKPRQN